MFVNIVECRYCRHDEREILFKREEERRERGKVSMKKKRKKDEHGRIKKENSRRKERKKVSNKKQEEKKRKDKKGSIRSLPFPPWIRDASHPDREHRDRIPVPRGASKGSNPEGQGSY